MGPKMATTMTVGMGEWLDIGRALEARQPVEFHELLSLLRIYSNSLSSTDLVRSIELQIRLRDDNGGVTPPRGLTPEYLSSQHHAAGSAQFTPVDHNVSAKSSRPRHKKS